MDDLDAIFDKKGPIRTVGVVGMGYVGIPAAMLFADSPAYDLVWGFQRDSPSSGYKIDMLNRGQNILKGVEPGLDELVKKVVDAKKFRCTSDYSKISELDAVTLDIQTPFSDPESLDPDYGSLVSGLKMVGRHIREGCLVVLESTVTPGTTCGMAKDILETESGMAAGIDFGLAHAPERVMVGRLLRNLREHDRIVGGINDASTRRAIGLYTPILTRGKVIPMSATAAEVTKTAENATRDLQIATINQLALYCEAMGINVYDVRAGIDSLKGDGITRALLYPGAGVGGHCLTKDSYHLELGVKRLGAGLDYPDGMGSLFILSRRINDFMPRHMYNLTLDALRRLNRKPAGSKVAMLGWSFLRNSDDARNTPCEPYRELLLHDGMAVEVHDPYVEKYPGVPISKDLYATVKDADVIAIMTGHSAYADLDAGLLRSIMGKEHPIIVDGRNVVDADNFIGNGFVYKGIGRGDRNEHDIVSAPCKPHIGKISAAS
jgi:UDP-N-acetyl-D-mannosaminuronic acid dehydrogenase